METEKTCAGAMGFSCTKQPNFHSISSFGISRMIPTSNTCTKHFNQNIDFLSMQASSSKTLAQSERKKMRGTFTSFTIKTPHLCGVMSSRQRTPHACNKCRERKTKCSGEKPVCQRCTNRGLRCEYSHRESRIRGPGRTHMPVNDSPFTGDSIRDSIASSPIPTQEAVYPQSQPIQRNPLDLTVDEQETNLAVSKDSGFLGSDRETYSEQKTLHLQHWADLRPCINSTVEPPGCRSGYNDTLPHISTTPLVIDYDPIQNPFRAQNPPLVNPSSSFGYGGMQHRSKGMSYTYADSIPNTHLPLGAQSKIDYQSSPVSTGLPASQPPIYSLVPLESSSATGHSVDFSSDYSTELKKYGSSGDSGPFELSAGDEEVNV